MKLKVELDVTNTEKYIGLIGIAKELISDEDIAEEVRVKYKNKLENIINNDED